MHAQLSLNTQQAYQPFYDEHAAGQCFAPTTVPFVVSNVDELKRQAEAGTIEGYLDANGVAQCARLPQAWENDQQGRLENRENRRNRLTPNWIMGDALTYGMPLARGTVVATFDRTRGVYVNAPSGNHTAIFSRWRTTEDGVQGMDVIQQMSGRGGRPEIGFIPFNTSNPYYSNAGVFNVVRITAPRSCTPNFIDNNTRRTIME